MSSCQLAFVQPTTQQYLIITIIKRQQLQNTKRALYSLFTFVT